MPQNHVTLLIEGNEVKDVVEFEYRIFTRNEANGEPIGVPKIDYIAFKKQLVTGAMDPIYKWSLDNRVSNRRNGSVKLWGQEAGSPIKELKWSDGFVDSLQIVRESMDEDPRGQTFALVKISCGSMSVSNKNGTVEYDNHFAK